MKITVTNLYLRIFDYVAENRLKKKDIDARVIHTQLAVIFSTSIFMWVNAFLSAYSILSPVPGIVGIICSSVHLISPMLFRYSSNTSFVTSILLGAILIQQSVFSFYSDGFLGNGLVWFALLPVIAGVLSGRKTAITWFIISLAFCMTFFILQMKDYHFPNLMSEEGRFLSQALMNFGFIILTFIIVMVYVELRQETENRLHEQSKKIDDLFRVLFHDLANPLGRIAIGLSIAKRQIPDGENNRGLEIAKNASDSMLEITQNIRRMYTVRKNRETIDLTYVPLNISVEYIQDTYAVELEKKKISFEYDFDKNSHVQILAEPISFNNQVLGNLLSNAIKFSPENSSISLSVNTEDSDRYVLELKDHGIGIPEHLIGDLFDINKKTSRPGTSGEVGSGFGLHIMKSFIEIYGGKVSVESSGNNGTCVRLFLKGRLE